MMKRPIRGRYVYLSAIDWEPTWTRPWTGIKAWAGRIKAITANRITPPPRPRAAARKEVAALTAIRMIAAAVPERKEDARHLWQEAKELNLIFSAIYRGKKNPP